MSKEWIVWGNRADAGEQGVRGMPHAMHFGTGFFRGDPLRAVALFGFCRGFSSLTRQSQLAVQSHRRLQRNERFLRTNPAGERRNRSEEHTSELQSHLNLVCRLLLEKKNQLRI